MEEMGLVDEVEEPPPPPPERVKFCYFCASLSPPVRVQHTFVVRAALLPHIDLYLTLTPPLPTHHPSRLPHHRDLIVRGHVILPQPSPSPPSLPPPLSELVPPLKPFPPAPAPSSASSHDPCHSPSPTLALTLTLKLTPPLSSPPKTRRAELSQATEG